MLDVLAWARQFVSIPSVSRDGNAEIAAAAAELAELVGLRTRLETAQVGGKEHRLLIADVGPETDDGLLLLTHLDTVPPGDPAAWTATGGNPFRPTRDGDRLYGLGSADAKVDFVCKAAAIEGLDPRRLRKRVRLVGTYAEEIGLLGARELVRRDETRGFAHALVGEPSELQAIRAHKGYAVYEARVRLERQLDVSNASVSELELEGESAHSSTPALGRNAIEAALERIARPDVLGVTALAGGSAVNKVPDRCALGLCLRGSSGDDAVRAVYGKDALLSFHATWRRLIERLAETKNADFDPDHSVASLGRVQIHEDFATFAFDVRPVPGVEPRAALEEIATLFDLECVRTNPPLATSTTSPLLRAVTGAQEKIGLGPRVATKATCTEAGVLAQAGLEVLVLGPGLSIGNVHRPNEYTRIPELFQARDLYRETIHRLCGGDACSS